MRLNRFTTCSFTPIPFYSFGGLPPKAREIS